MPQQIREATVILRRKQVEAQTGLSRSTIYKFMSDGTFPKPVRIGVRAVGWNSSSIEAVNAARISGKTDAEIRALVVKLETARRFAI